MAKMNFQGKGRYCPNIWTFPVIHEIHKTKLTCYIYNTVEFVDKENRDFKYLELSLIEDCTFTSRIVEQIGEKRTTIHEVITTGGVDTFCELLTLAEKSFLTRQKQQNPFVEFMKAVKRTDNIVIDKDTIVQLKYDGMRCFANLAYGMRSKNKRDFYVEDIWTKLQPLLSENPNLVFDGELYVPTLTPDQVMYYFTHNERKFSPIYMIFDMYDRSNYDLPADERQTRLKQLKQEFPKSFETDVQLAPIYSFENWKAIKAYLDEVVDKGEEGLIVRNPNSKYQFSKTVDLVKLKKYRDDEFAVVSYTDQPFKLICQTKNAVEFCVPCAKVTQKIVRQQVSQLLDPFIGQQITLKFYERNSKHVPTNPIFMRIRVI